jgi:MFS family permease
MLQVGFGLSPISSGSLTFIGSAGTVVIRSLLAHVVRRHGFRIILVLSSIAGSLALLGFSLLGPHTPHVVVLGLVFFFGLTRSAQYMTSNTLSYSEMPNSHLSRATSLGGALQQLSVSFGVSLSAILLALVSVHSHSLTPAHFQEVFDLTAIVPLLAIPGFMTLSATAGSAAMTPQQTVAEIETQD